MNEEQKTISALVEETFRNIMECRENIASAQSGLNRVAPQVKSDPDPAEKTKEPETLTEKLAAIKAITGMARVESDALNKRVQLLF